MISLKKIPFTHNWVYRKVIGRDICTLLDLGCGTGEFMKSLSDGEDWEITGVELYDNYAKLARRTGVYKSVVVGDALSVVRKLKKQKRRFDVVFCSHVLEHLTRENGEKLIQEAEVIAQKRVVFGTPQGFIEQPIKYGQAEEKYQEHKSGWTIKDFISRGYKVRGVGLMPLWSAEGLARSSNPLVFRTFRILSYILSPLPYFIPSLGAGIIAYKEHEK